MKIDTNNIAIEVIAHPNRCVRGNFIASGDSAWDNEAENQVIKELADGNIWAWCCVEVKVSTIAKQTLCSASSYLSGCNYHDKTDFIANSMYYEDMVAEAIESLSQTVNGEYFS